MSGPRDGFNIDFTNYKDRSSAHLTPGKYLVRVIDAEITDTKKGDPMVNLFYEVQGGSFAGSPLIDRLVLTDKALWRAVKVLRALGFKVEKRNMNFQTKLLIGRTLVVTVSDGEPYNDEIRSEIRDYAPGASWEGYTEAAPSEPVTTEAESVNYDDLPTEDTNATDEVPWEDTVSAAKADAAVSGLYDVELPAEGEISL